MASKKKSKKKVKRMNPGEVSLPKAKKPKKATVAYVDNKTLLAEMIVYRDSVLAYKENLKTDPTLKKPRIPEYVGACILKIANRLSSKPNFCNYTHREEMIGDGVENCLLYIDNFDPQKSSNPFAYFTQIIYYAFLRRIQREKKQTFVKMRLFEKMDSKGHIRRMMAANNMEGPANGDKEVTTSSLYADYFGISDTDVKFFEKLAETKVRKKKTNPNQKKSFLEDFFEN